MLHYIAGVYVNKIPIIYLPGGILGRFRRAPRAHYPSGRKYSPSVYILVNAKQRYPSRSGSVC